MNFYLFLDGSYICLKSLRKLLKNFKHNHVIILLIITTDFSKTLNDVFSL